MSGRPHTAETRAKLAEAGRKRAQTAETRAKLAVARLGKTHTPESRAIMSAARKGKPSAMKGRTVSDDTRARNSAAAKARWADPESRAAMLAAIKPPPLHLSSLTWPPERVARLRELWPDVSLSAADIGRKLGVSKGAVACKARRLGLPSRPSPLSSASPTRNRKGNRGRAHTPETRERLRQMALARAPMPGRSEAIKAGMPVAWTPERVDLLRALWPRLHLTVPQVVARVGLSRTTVNRKVRELGLPPRRAANGTARAKPSRAVQQVAARVPVAVERIPAPPDGGTTGERGCRFPLWPSGPAPRPALFCGQPRVGARSYCPCHVAVCFTPRHVAEAA